MDSQNSHQNNPLETETRLEEIRLLYAGTPFSYTASVVIALIIYIVLYGHVVSPEKLNIWLVIILGCRWILLGASPLVWIFI